MCHISVRDETGCRESAQHGHVRASHDLLSQRSTRDHPGSFYDGPKVVQDALTRLDSRSQRPSNAGDSSADAHFRTFPEAFGTDRGRVRIKVLSFHMAVTLLEWLLRCMSLRSAVRRSRLHPELNPSTFLCCRLSWKNQSECPSCPSSWQRTEHA